MNCPRDCINLENDGDAYTGCASYFCTNVAHCDAMLQEANASAAKAQEAFYDAQHEYIFGRASLGEVHAAEQELILAEMNQEIRAEAFSMAVTAPKPVRLTVTLDDEERANCAIHDDRCPELSDWL